MPDSTSLQEFVMSVRTRRRYHSQCTPEKTIVNVIGNEMYLFNIFNSVCSICIYKYN